MNLKVNKAKQTKIRKQDHIDLCRKDVESSDKYTGFSDYHFLPTSLPSFSKKDCVLKGSFLGKPIDYPLMITGMTGGVQDAKKINESLGYVANRYRIPMGVGSQRVAIEDKNQAGTFQLKKLYPDLFLIGNLGFCQIMGSRDTALKMCEEAVKMIDGDALAIHFNPLQELIQDEGDQVFENIQKNLTYICKKLPVPVVVKEVGCGFSKKDAKKLFSCGVASIDIGGRGGTSWGYIEGLRSESPIRRHLGEVFRDWGIPTAHCLSSLANAYPERTFTATGGIRSGLDVAKALALGAKVVGVGLPFLRAALVSAEEVDTVFQQYIEALRIVMVLTGSKKVQDLSKSLM